LEIRQTLRQGDYAKLLFQGPDAEGVLRVERMWVEVLASKGRRYDALLRNDPSLLPLRFGDRITFEAKHVAGCLRPALWWRDG